jgi:hypothetical protein
MIGDEKAVSGHPLGESVSEQKAVSSKDPGNPVRKAVIRLTLGTLLAVKIERFVQDITTAIRAATKTREVAQSKISPEYRFELKRLLYLAPAITEAVALDTNGVKQAHVSRAGAISSN